MLFRSTGGVSATIDVNRVWVGRWRGLPLASFQAETLDRVPWSEWASVPQTAKVPVGVDRQFGGFGLWPSHAAGGGINPGWINQGPSAVPRDLMAGNAPRSL